MKNFDSEKIRKKKMNYAFKFSTYLRSFLFKGYSHYEIKKKFLISSYVLTLWNW